MRVFGWDYKKAKNYGPVKRDKCNNCNNESTFHLQRLSTWFTLFLVPIIPYRVNYLLVCPICSKAIEIENSEFLEYIDMIQCQKDAESQLASQDAYITENGTICRTETQLNFIRQMKEIEMEREKRNSLNDK